MDSKVPHEWTQSNGILWKTLLPGRGNSSPILWGNRLFVQSATDDGAERLLLCLDAEDGRVLWSKSAPGKGVRINPRNTWASSTPATDGERVYAAFWDGFELSLCAYDFDGRQVWRRGLGSFNSEHGAGASPVVHGDAVLLSNDQDGSSTLSAFDARTGKTVWRTERGGFAACYSSPFLLERPGGISELIVGSMIGISAYDPRSGKEKWSWDWEFPSKPLRTVASPIYADGMIFLTSGDGGGARHAVAIHDPVGGKKPKLAWQTSRTLPYVPTMLAWDGHLYWVNDLGIAGCTRSKSGENVWVERLGGNFSSSPILVDGRVFCASEDGDVYVFLAAPEFKLLAKNPIGELIRATPAAGGGRLYVRGLTTLYCIGNKNQKG